MSSQTAEKHSETGTLLSSYQRNLDNLKLVMADPEIKSVVHRAREVLQLPPNGLPDSPDAIESWNRSFMARSMEALKSTKLQRFRAQIKQNIGEKKTEAAMGQKQIDMVYDEELPENYLTTTVEYILERHRLPKNFADSIRTYIIRNIYCAPAWSFSVRTVHDANSDQSQVMTTFHSEPTDADFKALKYMVTVVGQYLPNLAPIKNIDKKLRAEELWNGDRSRRAGDETYKASAEDIAGELEEEFGSTTKRGLVYESTRELRDKRKKHFRDLGNTA